jgi:hypothetical protein
MCYPWAVWVVQNHPRSFFCRVWSQLSKNSRRRPETARPLATSLPALRGEGCFFFRAPLLLHKGPDGPGKPAGLRNGYLLRRGAFATPALKRHRSRNLDTGPEEGLDSSTAPGGRW